MDNKELKVALVHDFLNQYGGAERVLKVFGEMYPEAPIYTLLYDRKKMRGMIDEKRIKTSYLQKFPNFLRRRHRWLLPFFMVMPEAFDLRDYDLVISSSGAWTKGIVTKLDTIHVAYLHSPMRFVWDYNDKYAKEIKQKKLSLLARVVLNYVRVWDRLAADRPDYLIANSRYTQKRIQKYYRREAEVIYPPVAQETCNMKHETCNKMQNARDEGLKNTKYQILNTKYFLVVSRLSPYKRVDIVVEAFNKLKLPLVVVGEGEQLEHLRKIAKENVKIVGWKNDEEIAELYANARAFIFPAEDDFGITAVEAMFCGVPVIAYRSGGVCETVIEGKTGEFFDAQTPEVLADGVRRFLEKEGEYDREVVRARAGEFSRERFIEKFGEYIDRIINKS